MNFLGKRILVVGLARSGQASAKVLCKYGARVTGCDNNPAEKLIPGIREIQDMGVNIVIGSYPEVSSQTFDLVVASPGVPLEISPFQQAFQAGIPVIGELELAYRLKSSQLEMYAVTGTNGKTTTTTLLEAILKQDGREARYGGNIGIPLTKLVDVMDSGVISVEVSSFQLETAVDFRPHICGLLNITPDHLDRHKTMEAYIAAKGKIFKNQRPEDYAVINFQDDILRGLATECPSQVIFFATDQELPRGVYMDQGMITYVDDHQRVEIIHQEDILLRGKHNLENILCAVGMSLVAGVTPEAIKEVLSTFSGVKHRMEEVPTKDGILYINDSKATNPDSAIKALESFDRPVILIAGGRNKGSDFGILASFIKDKVRDLILLGEARDEIKEAVIKAGFKNINVVKDLSEAVHMAHQLARAGDVVLLSPACASWDMFESYEQRGDIFRQLVLDLN